jgi:hypothetical protein
VRNPRRVRLKTKAKLSELILMAWNKKNEQGEHAEHFPPLVRELLWVFGGKIALGLVLSTNEIIQMWMWM